MWRLDTPINLDIPAFFRWWRKELAFLVPAWLKRMLGHVSHWLVLTKQGDAIQVTFFDAERGSRALGSFSLDEAGVQRWNALLEDEPLAAEAKRLLRLQPDQAFLRTIKLPAAAEENLFQVIGFEMDRLTPFRLDQVYYSARLLDRLPETQQIRVEVLVAPRKYLDLVLEELAASQWRPEVVDVCEDPWHSHHNLLPDKYRPEASKFKNTLNSLLAGLLIVLALAALVMPVRLNRTLIEELEQEVKKASRTAQEVESLRQEADRLQHETRFLLDKKRTEPSMVDMLEELTQVIPDSTWLYGLQYRDRKLTVQGQSPSASSLIELIEASPFFRNTSFVSPVTKDAASGLERFQIAIEVLNARFSGSSPAGAEPPAAPAETEPEGSE